MSKKAKKKELKFLERDLITNTIQVFTDFMGVRRIGEVIGLSYNTGWVRIMMGAKTYVTIKRHWTKHNVSLYRVRSKINEDVHTETGN